MLGHRPLVELDLVALDLEATGVAHGHDRVVEIGAARFRLMPDGRVAPGPIFEAMVDPGMPIPPVVSRLTGIDDDAVRGKPTLDRVWAALLAFLGDREETLVVAHCARSDLAYFGSEILRLGLEPPRVRWACTLEIAKRVVPEAPRFGLEPLRTLLGEGPLREATFHRAVADALHTRNLFAALARRAEARVLKDLGVTTSLAIPGPEAFAVEVPERLRVALEPAIAEQRRVAIAYDGGSKGNTLRPVTPLAFFAQEGVPLLRAWCHLDDEAKSFRCDRIRRVVPFLGAGAEEGLASGG
ncbi:MAG: WYL domain-containing protein [Deltaproteobacteria bacterium]|nr:WYL domain-containing protein [Deltaproteobacteria bacterium]